LDGGESDEQLAQMGKRLRRLVGAASAANEMVVVAKAPLDKSVFSCYHNAGAALAAKKSHDVGADEICPFWG